MIRLRIMNMKNEINNNENHETEEKSLKLYY